jgi:MFS family permease
VWTDTSQVIYKAGSATGEIFGAFFMDRFGRKLTHLVGILGVGVFGVAVILSPNLLVFNILRFILGIFITVSIYPLCLFNTVNPLILASN